MQEQVCPLAPLLHLRKWEVSRRQSHRIDYALRLASSVMERRERPLEVRTHFWLFARHASLGVFSPSLPGRCFASRHCFVLWVPFASVSSLAVFIYFYPQISPLPKSGSGTPITYPLHFFPSESSTFQTIPLLLASSHAQSS